MALYMQHCTGYYNVPVKTSSPGLSKTIFRTWKFCFSFLCFSRKNKLISVKFLRSKQNLRVGTHHSGCNMICGRGQYVRKEMASQRGKEF